METALRSALSDKGGAGVENKNEKLKSFISDPRATWTAPVSSKLRSTPNDPLRQKTPDEQIHITSP